MGRKGNSASPNNAVIIVAIISLFGTAITALLTYFASMKPSDFELALIATQTAEIRQTAAAQVLAFNPSGEVSYSPQPNSTEEISNIQITQTPNYTEVVETNNPQDLTITATIEEVINLQLTVTPENRIDPVEFINDYFSLINERRYEDAWAKLSTRFKENFANRTGGGGYDDYVTYWNTVAKVEIAFAEIHSQSDTKALVYAEIIFSYKAGNTETGLITYKLVKDASGKSWLFDPN